MILISPRMSVLGDRTKTDEQARQAVVAAYREACGNRALSQGAFDAALARYKMLYPHINKTLAAQAVAYILSTEEV